MVNVTIDGKKIQVREGTTIMDAAARCGIPIPSLCYLKDINEIAACRVCVVELEGKDRLITSCNNVVAEGMVLYTNSPKVRRHRRKIVELLLSQHDCLCATCQRSGNCSLQKIANDLNILEIPFHHTLEHQPWNKNFPLLRKSEKCIKCMRCVQICEKVQGLGIWTVEGTGSRVTINVSGRKTIEEADCSLCGQCITHCPVGALTARDDTEKVWEAIEDPDKIVVAQVAPAVRTAWGEELGLSPEEATIGRIMDALKRMGVDYAFDTVFSADLTIMEEANEFVQRVKNGGMLPMITSCSPGWVKYCEHYFPEMTENLSSCKSPQQMFGAVAKSYWAEKMGIDPKKIVMVSVMPCTAKKFEIHRADEDANGVPDVDIALTTRELARMIDRAGIDFRALADENFDQPLGSGTGAAVIFGATGGVMEAALRTAVYMITGEDAPSVDFTEVRGVEGIKEATYEIDGVGPVKVAVASGLANARDLLKKVRSGEADYQFIEIMGCPGGCVNGGGQPQVPYGIRNFVDIRAERAKVLYNLDAKNLLRKSYENPDIQELYKNYLGEPGSEKAHHLLHTTYVKRTVNRVYGK